MKITGNRDEGYGFQCDDGICDFSSTGWSSKSAAAARAAEHKREHETGESMSELRDFERKQS